MKKVPHSRQLTIKQALSRAKKATKQGNTAVALRLYNTVLQHQPNHPVAKKGLRKLQQALPPNQAVPVETANPPQDQINKLISLYQSGLLLQTEQVCRELLERYPQSLIVFNALGVSLKAQGKLQQAVASYDKAIEISPDYAEAYSNRGNALQDLGQLQKAVASHDEAIQIKPDYAEAYSNRGNALQDLDRLEDAVESYDKAIQLKPDFTMAYFNRGNALIGLGQLLAAVASHEKAIQIKPDYAEAYSNRGHALKELGRFDEALTSYNKAIQLKPDYAEAYSNRGNTLSCLGQLKEAVANYSKAIQLKPDYVEAYSNQANVLIDLDQIQDALACHDKAIQIKPDYAEAYSNRGNILRELAQFQEALACHDKAIQIKPDYAEAYSNRGNVLLDLGRLQETVASHEKAIQIKPDYAKAHSFLLMALNYAPNYDAIDRLAMAHRFGEVVTEKAQFHFSTYQCPPFPSRLRVGLVSGDLCSHPVGHFLEGILSSIDSSKIELIAYPTSPIVDELSQRIRPFFSSWKPIYGRNDNVVANLIVEDGVHVLLDLSGHTASNRLPMFAYKPAPVQVSWLGYFATTGLSEMDYLLGDPYVTPPKYDEQFTEKVWRLPETRWCFTPPNVDVVVSMLPALNNGYVTFGCFNNLAKVNNKVVELWAKVLEAIPNSQLLLKAKQFNDQSVRESVTQRFTAQGVNSNRVVLEGPEDRHKYFAAYNRVDITLDPFPFTGGTTSVESLWMGVPLISLAGDSLVSRQGVGILMNAGLPDWIADDEEEYLAKAILFASDLDTLVSLRAGLRSQVLASPLFDAPRFARNFEDALQEMWNQRAGQS